MFPEGTRHADDEIHPFLPGAAVLAQRLGRPIIPVYIGGAHDVLAKHGILINARGVEVRVIIGEPMFAKESEDVAGFNARVHEWFLKEAGRP